MRVAFCPMSALTLAGAVALGLGLWGDALGESSETERVAAAPVFNPAGEPLDYSDRETCGKFGGAYELILGHPGEYICTEIDINQTFCIGASKDALPCKGLYDHVRRCNHYNRVALDPFYCAGVCDAGFACGKKCFAAALSPTIPPGTEIPVPNSPIPEEYGNSPVFLKVAPLAEIPVNVHYELLQDGLVLTLSRDVNTPNRALVGLVAPENLLVGERYEFTVRAGFSCAGLAAMHHEARVSFRLRSVGGTLPPIPGRDGFLRTSGGCGVIRVNDGLHLSIGPESCDSAD